MGLADAGTSTNTRTSDGALERPMTYPERRRRPPVRLSAGARAAFAAISEVVAPERRSFGFDAGAWGVEFLEGYVPYLPRALRRLLPLGLVLFDWAALPLSGGRFSRLPRERRLRHLARLERSRLLHPLAEVFSLLRGLAALAFYSHPALAAHFGYAHQPWMDQKVRERRERFGAPEPW